MVFLKYLVVTVVGVMQWLKKDFLLVTKSRHRLYYCGVMPISTKEGNGLQ